MTSDEIYACAAIFSNGDVFDLNRYLEERGIAPITDSRVYIKLIDDDNNEYEDYAEFDSYYYYVDHIKKEVRIKLICAYYVPSDKYVVYMRWRGYTLFGFQYSPYPFGAAGGQWLSISVEISVPFGSYVQNAGEYDWEELLGKYAP